MPRADVNKIAEMEIFAQVVEHGGFSAAASTSSMTPSAISKLIARLENRLNVRLINRSTRRFRLTDEGNEFYENSLRILSDIEELERSTNRREKPCGRIKISTSASYATHILAPILPKFIRLYPEISIELLQTDQILDIISEKVDVAIRAVPLKDSSLIARKLGETTKTIVASPDYIARTSMPKTLSDLNQHTIISFSYKRAIRGWPVLNNGEITIFNASGQIRASEGEAIRQLAINGNGITRLATFTIYDDIKNGRLLPILEDLNPHEKEEFHAIHVGHSGLLPVRVRVLLDFLVEFGKLQQSAKIV